MLDRACLECGFHIHSPSCPRLRARGDAIRLLTTGEGGSPLPIPSVRSRIWLALALLEVFPISPDDFSQILDGGKP